jgi:hypothetical protein
MTKKRPKNYQRNILNYPRLRLQKSQKTLEVQFIQILPCLVKIHRFHHVKQLLAPYNIKYTPFKMEPEKLDRTWFYGGTTVEWPYPQLTFCHLSIVVSRCLPYITVSYGTVHHCGHSSMSFHTFYTFVHMYPLFPVGMCLRMEYSIPKKMSYWYAACLADSQMDFGLFPVNLQVPKPYVLW